MVSTIDEGTITLSEGGILTSSYLKDATEKIVPCSDSKFYCEEKISEYGNKQIDALLSPHLQQEYFNKVFTGNTDKACQKISEKTIGQTASNSKITHSLITHRNSESAALKSSNQNYLQFIVDEALLR